MIQQQMMIKEAEEIQIAYNDLPVKPQTILKAFGYNNIPKYLIDMLVKLLREAHQYMELRAGFGIFPITRLDY